MKISLAADHRGFAYKEKIKKFLMTRNIEIEDVGADSAEISSDYPDYGIKAARSVADGDAQFAILVCGTGNGMAIAANKVKGIRAGLALNPEMARLARAHNDANVLVMSAMFTPEESIPEIIDRFLETRFDGDRHERRIGKISDFEQGR